MKPSFLLSVARWYNRNVVRWLMTAQVFIPSGARSPSALAKTIYNLVTRKAWVGHSELQTRSAHVCKYPMVSFMTSYSNFYVTAHFFFLGSMTRAHFMLNSWRARRNADMCIHRLWNNVYDRWVTSNFPCKWHRTASSTSGWKSSPARILHLNSFGQRRLKFIASGEHGDNIVKLLHYIWLAPYCSQLFDFSLCMLWNSYW